MNRAFRTLLRLGLVGSAALVVATSVAEPPRLESAGRLGTPRLGHPGRGSTVAYSPDGRWLVTGGQASPTDRTTVQVRDASTLALIREFDSGGEWATALAFSPDGRTLAVGCQDGGIAIWDLDSWTLQNTFGLGLNCCLGLAFSPDGKILASCHMGGPSSDDEPVRLWDWRKANRTGELNDHCGWIISLVFAPDGKTLASGSWEGEVRIWDASTHKLIRTLAHKQHMIFGLAYSPDGSMLTAVDRDEVANVWSPRTGDLLRRVGETPALLTQCLPTADSLAGSPTRPIVAIGKHPDTARVQIVRLLDVRTGEDLGELQGDASWIGALAFSPDGRSLATIGEAGTVRVWDVATRQERNVPTGHSSAVLSIAFSPQGRRVATGGRDGRIGLWDARGRSLIRMLTPNGPPSDVLFAAFVGDGSRLATASRDGWLRVWDVETGELRKRWDFGRPILEAAATPDGARVAAAGEDGVLIVLRTRSGDEAFQTRLLNAKGKPIRLHPLVFSADGEYLAASDDDKTIRLWKGDPPDPVRILHEAGKLPVKVVGGRFLGIESDGFVSLQNFDERRELHRLGSNDRPFYSDRLILTPDGRKLASGSRFNGFVSCWDVTTTSETGRADQRFEVTSIAFSPDGSVLATGTVDGLVNLWKTPTPQNRPGP